MNRVLDEGGQSAAEKLALFFRSIEEEFRVSINLHDLAGISHVDPAIQAVLEPYLYHNNPFCNAVKRVPGGMAACGLNKEILCRSFQSQTKPFYGACWLGIEELRYPIRWNGKLLGFLCVGQFCSDRAEADRRLEHHAARHGLAVEELKRLYRRVARPLDLDIRSFGHHTGFLADYLALLYARHVLARGMGTPGDSDAREHTRHYLVTRAKAFVQVHFTSPLTLKVLASHVYCSETYLSALFRKAFGVSPRAYRGA